MNNVCMRSFRRDSERSRFRASMQESAVRVAAKRATDNPSHEQETAGIAHSRWGKFSRSFEGYRRSFRFGGQIDRITITTPIPTPTIGNEASNRNPPITSSFVSGSMSPMGIIFSVLLGLAR
jgi:hypothetical protein